MPISVHASQYNSIWMSCLRIKTPTPAAGFTNDADPSSVKPSLKLNGGLAKFGLTSLVKSTRVNSISKIHHRISMVTTLIRLHIHAFPVVHGLTSWNWPTLQGLHASQTFYLLDFQNYTFLTSAQRLSKTRGSENDNTPPPLYQWTNSPFYGPTGWKLQEFHIDPLLGLSICHALWPKSEPIMNPTLYPTRISFIPSRSTFPFLKYGYQKFDVINPRSRSWVRSNF